MNRDPLHTSDTNQQQALVVAPVTTPQALDNLDPGRIQLCSDIVEFRIDCLRSRMPDVLAAMRRCPLPVLVTARCPAEGGEGDLDAIHRAALLRQALPHAQYADIELISFHELSGVVGEARAAGVRLIGSFHDFQQTPGLAELEQKVAAGVALGVDIVKIATRLNCHRDLYRLIDLLEGERRLPLSVMGMGSLGKVSRLFAAQCGSALNYGYIDEQSVPGQVAAADLKAWIEDLPASD